MWKKFDFSYFGSDGIGDDDYDDNVVYDKEVVALWLIMMQWKRKNLHICRIVFIAFSCPRLGYNRIMKNGFIHSSLLNCWLTQFECFARKSARILVLK